MPDNNKRQLIDAIRKFNTTVDLRFLMDFDEPALQQYLEHLQDANNHVARISTWNRKTSRTRLIA